MSDQHEVVEAMQEAVDGRIASVTIAGRTYDRLDTLAQAYCEALRLLHGAGVVEIGARNPNVASYCDHWERRAEKAEAILSEREKELARLRSALEPFAGIGQWLFVLPRADDSPAVEFEGINNYKPVLTVGHFRAAHLALWDDEQIAALSPSQESSEEMPPREAKP